MSPSYDAYFDEILVTFADRTASAIQRRGVCLPLVRMAALAAPLPGLWLAVLGLLHASAAKAPHLPGYLACIYALLFVCPWAAIGWLAFARFLDDARGWSPARAAKYRAIAARWREWRGRARLAKAFYGSTGVAAGGLELAIHGASPSVTMMLGCFALMLGIAVNEYVACAMPVTRTPMPRSRSRPPEPPDARARPDTGQASDLAPGNSPYLVLAGLRTQPGSR